MILKKAITLNNKSIGIYGYMVKSNQNQIYGAILIFFKETLL